MRVVEQLERGELEPFPLRVDPQRSFLVVGKPLSEEERAKNLLFYYAYRLGGFSTIPVSYLDLGADSVPNVRLVEAISITTHITLRELTPGVELDEPEDEEEEEEPPYDEEPPEEEEDPF
jgi:hypothetical protein